MVSRTELDSISKVQSDAFQANLQNIISIFENRVSKLEADLSASKQNISDLRKTNVEQQKLITDLQQKETAGTPVKDRLDDLEDRSMRNNLKIDGLVEEEAENWEQSVHKVLQLVKDKLDIKEKIEVERAHRVGKKSEGRPRPIVVKFLRYQDREKILRNSKKLKNTNIYINEDLCEASIAKRKSLLPQLRAAREQGKIAFFSHTKLVIRDRREPNSAPVGSEHQSLRRSDRNR